MRERGDPSVRGHLQELYAVLLAMEPLARADEPDAAHQMRIASRRISAGLAVYGDALGIDGIPHLRPELRWLTAVLGQARDAEVLLERLTVVTQAPPQLRTHLQNVHAEALQHLRTALVSPRYAELVAVLGAALAPSPPSPPGRDLRGGPEATRCVQAEWQRAQAAYAAWLLYAPDGPGADHRLHDVRRATRRLRYACEAMAGPGGQEALGRAGAAKEVQDILGEHQDAAVSTELLSLLAAADPDPAHAATYARLLEVEEQARIRSRDRFAGAWAALADPRGWHWARA